MDFAGFIGPSYTLESPSANAQRAVNIYPEMQEAGPRKGNVRRFVGTPGLRRRSTLGQGPVRGAFWSSTDQLFVVSGNLLYEVSSDGTAIPRAGSVSSGSGRVTMADNGTTLMICDGSSAAYDVPLVAGSPVIPVADPNCPGGWVTYQDGYFIHTVPNSNEFALSGLNAVTYDPTDVAEKEGRPDQLVIAISVNEQLWLFGDQTTEVWFDSGDALFPFQRVQSAFIETGTVSAATCCRIAGSLAWVGNSERGRGTVWYAQGYLPMRISTHAVELALSGYSRLSEAYAFAYQQRGHEFYQLTVPGAVDGSDTGGTWVYDFATSLWHERTHLSSTGEGPHRAYCATVAFGEVVVGDSQDGRLYVYDLDYDLDDAAPIRRMRQAPHISQGEKWIRYDSFELQCEPGVGLSTGQGSAPTVILQWSNDGGHTWGNEHQTSLGAMGKYKNRAKWRRLGIGRDRVFRVIVTDPVHVTWMGAELDLVQLGA